MRCSLCLTKGLKFIPVKLKMEAFMDIPAVDVNVAMCPSCARSWNGDKVFQGGSKKANRVRRRLVTLTGHPWSWSRTPEETDIFRIVPGSYLMGRRPR
jgi:hypothetical protein